VPAAAGVAVVLVLAGLVQAGRSLPLRHGRAGAAGHSPAAGNSPAAGQPAVLGQSATADPPDFVGVLQPGGLTMFSPVTGRAVRSLPAIGISNGFTLAPDSSRVFVTSLLSRQLEIRSISVRTRKISSVADGAHPAVSPDSRFLAYATGTQQYTGLAIRDLATGTTRSIGLLGLVGADASLLNGQLTWLGDGMQVVALPQPDAVAAGQATSPSKAAVGNACGQQDSPRGLCLIVVDANSSRLQGRRVYVRWAMLPGASGDSNAVTISGLVPAQRTLLLATSFVSSPVFDAVIIDGGSLVDWEFSPLPLPARASLMAIAPGGDRVPYLTAQDGSAQPALWVAQPRDGRLADQHRLYVDTGKVSFGAAAW
jgi:hypothetical protein